MNEQPLSQPSQSPPPSQPKRPPWIVGMIILIIVLCISTGYLYMQNQSLKQQLASPPTPTPLPTDSAFVATSAKEDDSTANWKTYTNDQFGFTIRYPAEWQVQESHNPIKQAPYYGSKTSDSVKFYSNTDYIQFFTGVEFETSYPTQQRIRVEPMTLSGKNLEKEIYSVSGQKTETMKVVIKIPNSTPFRIDALFQSADSNIIDQILSTFRFVNSPVTTSPTSSLLPSGWTARAFPTYSLTLYSPSNWKSNIQDYPKTSSSLIRFWQGATPDTATIQLDIKDSWANTGDAPYLPKNYTVNGNIAAVRVDPPQKTEETLDRYQTNVYFEHGSKTYVFTCVHNWIPEQLQICNTMLQTIQFSQ